MGKLFGTDGIRGVANVFPMTPEMVLNVGKAVAHVFKERSGKTKPKFVIGKDTRLSGYMLENAIASESYIFFLILILATPKITRVCIQALKYKFWFL